MNWEVISYAGLAAFGGLVVSLWGQLKAFAIQIKSYFVVTVTIEGNALVLGVMRLLATKGRTVSLPNPGYTTKLLYVLSNRKYEHVVGEVPSCGRTASVYWLNGTLCWVAYSGSSNLTLYGLRRWFNADQILREANKQYEIMRQNWDSQLNCTTSRFYVECLYGEHRTYNRNPLAGLQKKKPSSEEGNSSASYYEDLTTEDFIHVARLLDYRVAELSTSSVQPGTMGRLILAPYQQELIREFKQWLNNQAWYEKCGIPWRRGWLFEGEPGTGKSIFARALAEYGSMPLFVPDLSSMNNEEFHKAFEKIAMNLPAVVLLEDFDNDFHDRENVSGSDLTFDCLINHLDGVNQYAGLFLIITTNHPEKLSGAIIDRPGRIDRRISFQPFGLDERRQMAHNILSEHPDIAEKLARDSEEVPAVVFQEKCFETACHLFWEKEDAESGANLCRDRGPAEELSIAG